MSTSEESPDMEFMITVPTINNQFKTTVVYSCTNPMTFIGGSYETKQFLSVILKKESDRKIKLMNSVNT